MQHSRYRAAVGSTLASFALAMASAQAAESAFRFTEESAQRGVADVAVNSTGPVFADFDADGHVDIYVPVEDLAEGLHDRLFHNDGKGNFKDVSVARGIDNPRSLSRGASWGDFDRDGDLDLIVATMQSSSAREPQHPTTLFKNMLKETGQPNFVNVTRESGLMRAGNEDDAKIGGVGDTGAGVAWGDFDGDGYLDVFLKNADGEIENVLFRNDGDGTFTDVTEKSGVAVQEKSPESNAQGAPNWTDVDQDGKLDLIITNEGTSKFVLRNKGDGTFEDITRNRKPPAALPFANPGNSEGACIGDIDNDGDMDVFLPTADQANRLFLSKLKDNGALSYEDITLKSGVGDMNGARGCAMADFDNDGWVDIVVNNGGPSNVLINDVIAGFPSFVQFYIAWEKALPTVYRNNGDRTFTDVTKGSGLEIAGIGSGVGAADVDGNGFADLFLANRTYYSDRKRVSEPGQNRLFINAGNDNQWFKLRLQGTRSNPQGYGAIVKVVAGDLVQYQELTSAHGYNSANDQVVSFGLGSRSKVDEVEIRWPSGVVQKLKRVKLKQTTQVVEPKA